ncbi:hypothetical protein Ocin01_18253 [Orchesella cincta]|uniref:Uncharacterized protein n=1 Tax=Orchesella cincta TaxID=48709 RepID=A0A1D2M685_ORCCI|nr:hypothetical protein Ocin01_18253 [Orchesella cincta]
MEAPTMTINSLLLPITQNNKSPSRSGKENLDNARSVNNNQNGNNNRRNSTQNQSNVNNNGGSQSRRNSSAYHQTTARAATRALLAATIAADTTASASLHFPPHLILLICSATYTPQLWPTPLPERNPSLLR